MSFSSTSGGTDERKIESEHYSKLCEKKRERERESEKERVNEREKEGEKVIERGMNSMPANLQVGKG